MRKLTKWLEKYVPLGIDVSVELFGYFASMIIATLQTMTFFYNYAIALGGLYTANSGRQELIKGALIQDFETLLKGCFTFSVIMFAITLCRAGYYYFYHYQGSNMMYLMKRLPDKWELHKRCLTLPVAGAVFWIVWAGALRLLYFIIYLLCTPSQCLPL